MGTTKHFLALIIVALAAFLYLSLFTVQQWQRALVIQFGEVQRVIKDPGLYMKIPFINNVYYFDGRILSLDAEPERYLTSEKKNVIVDSFVKWRIGDVQRYYTAVGGDEIKANNRLLQIIKDGLRGEFGKRTIQDVISGERSQIMAVLSSEASKVAKISVLKLLICGLNVLICQEKLVVQFIVAWKLNASVLLKNSVRVALKLQNESVLMLIGSAK